MDYFQRIMMVLDASDPLFVGALGLIIGFIFGQLVGAFR